MTVYIYGLRCPVAGEIRYIGKSDDPARRYKAHIGESRRGFESHKSRWIAKLARSGLEPTLEILREVADGEDWAEAERAEIARGRAAGWPLTNMTHGGEGAALTPAARAAKLKIMGRPETRAKMKASAAAKWADPEKSARLRASLTSAEARQNQAESARRRATPEYRQMMADRSKAAWADPKKRARIEAGITDEVRATVSAASKKFWTNSPKAQKCLQNLNQDPETLKRSLEKAREARLSEEGRAKHFAATQTPEFRAKVSAALKASWERRKREG